VGKEMKWVKLTLLEAGFLRDVIDSGRLNQEWFNEEKDYEEALELLDAAVDNAEEEEIDG